MSRSISTPVALTLTVLMLFAGCRPMQPFYLHEDGDLSHYLEQATDLEYPDVETATMPEVTQTHPPITLSSFEEPEYWELSLEEAVSITLQNSKVIRNLGAVTPFGFADGLVSRTATSPTVYDPAIAEADVETALSEFDAQFSITGAGHGGQNGLFSRLDRPQNLDTGGGALGFFPQAVQDDNGGLRFGLSKRTAVGTTLSFANQTDYNRGNSRGGVAADGGVQALSSFWTTSFEMRADQPLLRGRGAQVNRIRSATGSPGVMLARINTDITLAEFEVRVRNLLLDVENTYWDLYASYRAVETARIGRDSAQVTWRIVYQKLQGGISNAQQEAQAREQYFFFRAALETALSELIAAENRLRWLMGLTATDGRLIRPSDEPTLARVNFEWRDIHVEALARSAELRQQRWVVKRAELDLIWSRNQVLPQMDVGALYRWVGLGDQLVNADRNGLDFPAVGSTAWDVMTGGQFQEFGFFFNFQTPVGVRGALSGVRRAQLQLAQSKSRLEDMELNSTHLLTSSLRDLDRNYLLTQSQFNRWKAAGKEVESVIALYEGDKATLDLVLDAQRRRAQSQIEYYRALTSYNKSIAEVHFRKGSLLEYGNVYLAEGPWVDKAYGDALEKARERDASYYLDYGWTRPRVISQGPVQQQGASIQMIDQGPGLPGEYVPTPAPDRELEGPPVPQGPVTSHGAGPELQAPTAAQPLQAGGGELADAEAQAPFPWGTLGLEQARHAPLNSLRLASYEEQQEPSRP